MSIDLSDRYYLEDKTTLIDKRNNVAISCGHITGICADCWNIILTEGLRALGRNKTILKYKLKDYGMPPTKAYDTDLGIDIYSPIDIKLSKDDDVKKIKTGVCFQFPNGYGGIIKDRSSLASKGVHILGGVIDEDYTGEIILCVKNFNNKPYEIKRGDRIAQMILIKTSHVILEKTNILEDTERGSNGFGSTGK